MTEPDYTKKIPGQRYIYMMTEEELTELLTACCEVPLKPEAANEAWQELGYFYDFDYTTALPLDGYDDQRFFSAVAVEPEEKIPF